MNNTVFFGKFWGMVYLGGPTISIVWITKACVSNAHFWPNFWFIFWSELREIFSCRYPYIAGLINFSQMWALYCLVQFYNVTHHRLQSIRPLAKFISFKAIVFATWWQGVGIAILCSLGVLPKQGKFQNGLQDFLICIEVSPSIPLLCHRWET